ncbi:MAG: hypothetical protein GOMPHAMPRED_001175 [Gomphillus americanus]|uniref:Uncharacterized protein n=1 Tax=Gomphillus americanus TaxID=1940652 RepID=A0A8H3IFS5_9LECA|nr:MAG: hypothetical protein GOMPHAMPRED_001175 [Gomphillus americanus]
MKNSRATVRGSALRKTKALALLQELQQAEEQRLAELHPDYQPITHLNRHEIMDSSQDADYMRAGQPYNGSFQNNLLSSELQVPMAANKGQHPLHASYRDRSTELSYDKVGSLSYHKSHHRKALSDSITELDASIAADTLAELPGPEIDTPRCPTNTWRSCTDYGDKRYNTLPGEAIPLKKSNVVPHVPKSNGSRKLGIGSTRSPLLTEQ